MLSLLHIERVSMENRIKFISTPTTCKECDHYDAKAKKCKADYVQLGSFTFNYEQIEIMQVLRARPCHDLRLRETA